jgi:hypothetical protein
MSRSFFARVKLAALAPLVSFLAVLSVASLTPACVKKEPAPPPAPPPPPPAPPGPIACGPVGLWNVTLPNGTSDEVEVVQGSTPDTFIVKHKSAASMPGAGQYANHEFTVDLQKTTFGLYHCKVNDDCKTMNCGFAGGPAVMTKK